MTGNVDSNVRPDPDQILVKIADYVLDKNIESKVLIKQVNIHLIKQGLILPYFTILLRRHGYIHIQSDSTTWVIQDVF